ncbi:hypothetical protein NEOLEDRAFT_1182887 [Neolentinus lepideus HHB14362 ss-1]|uniref:Uncharacterized protein n=1 Tax=Neolentinus lepideus HHB14362 ss-1 TaxID=1314782 RepID=A0A165NSX4_9AGAM|nr:hypothetical protein NEOLEDRAFT_1182887 [Neolentinus lepideus HHB14362 ss-1]
MPSLRRMHASTDLHEIARPLPLIPATASPTSSSTSLIAVSNPAPPPLASNSPPESTYSGHCLPSPPLSHSDYTLSSPLTPLAMSSPERLENSSTSEPSRSLLSYSLRVPSPVSGGNVEDMRTSDNASSTTSFIKASPTLSPPSYAYTRLQDALDSALMAQEPTPSMSTNHLLPSLMNHTFPSESTWARGTGLHPNMFQLDRTWHHNHPPPIQCHPNLGPNAPSMPLGVNLPSTGHRAQHAAGTVMGWDTLQFSAPHSAAEFATNVNPATTLVVALNRTPRYQLQLSWKLSVILAVTSWLGTVTLLSLTINVGMLLLWSTMGAIPVFMAMIKDQ